MIASLPSLPRSGFLFAVFFSFTGAASLSAQVYAPSATVVTGSEAMLPPIDQLLAPIALYPDPLIALILPAATDYAGVQAAASFLGANGNPAQIENQTWNDGIKGLAHYPDVLKWLADNPAWTQQLGATFASSPADVMNAVQDLRRRAQAAGTLTNTPQQQVIVENGDLNIVPASAEVIYVPRYDPDVVYLPQTGYWSGPYLTFGAAYPMGIWMSYDFDWRAHRLWAGNWYAWHRDNGGWRVRPHASTFRNMPPAVHARAWQAPRRESGFRSAPAPVHNNTRPDYNRPRMMPGAQPAPPTAHRFNSQAPRGAGAPHGQSGGRSAPPSNRDQSQSRDHGRGDRDRK